MGVEKTNGAKPNQFVQNQVGKRNYWEENFKLGSLWDGAKKQFDSPVPPYSQNAWEALSEDEKAVILEERKIVPGITVEHQVEQSVQNEDVTNTNTSQEETPEQDVNTQPMPPKPGSPERYKGEIKPVQIVDWSNLNGNYFEVIDEPDENGKLPTRPIHGKLTVEGNVNDGENPKRVIITDQDNGKDYVFELQDSKEGEPVIYKCVSGPGGVYKKGNDYQLNTINGVPMLIQAKDSGGHGLAVGKSRETSEPLQTESPETETPAEPAETPANPTSAQPAQSTTNQSPETKVKEDAEAIIPDMNEILAVNEEEIAEAKKVEAAYEKAPEKAKALVATLSHDWLGADIVTNTLNSITPTEFPYVINELLNNDGEFNLAAAIENVLGLDEKDVFNGVIKKLQTRMQELGLPELKLDMDKPITEDASLEEMQSWIMNAASLIIDADNENYSKVNFANEFKPYVSMITSANQTLAEVANMEPKPKIEKTKNGNEYVQLSDGRVIAIERDKSGNIQTVTIQKDTTEKSKQIPDVKYTVTDLSLNTDETNEQVWDVSFSGAHDFAKVLELAKQIFG